MNSFFTLSSLLLLREREKEVIILHSSSRSFTISSFISSEISLSFAKIKTILAFSKVDLLAILRNCVNSFFEVEPLPSAMLFGIDMPALLSWSAKRYNLFSSKISAKRNNFRATSTARCQIFKFSKRKFIIFETLIS